jgi:hypothetical protein
MATGRKGTRVGSGDGSKAGKSGLKPKKAGLKDLDAKRARSVRGGNVDLLGSCTSGKHIDKVIITT